MLVVEFTEGAPGANKELAVKANKAVRHWKFRKNLKNLSSPERLRDKEAVIRETSAAEVLRRMEKRRETIYG
jgi:hypothetical protein